MTGMCIRSLALMGVVAIAGISLPACASGGGEPETPAFNSPWGPVRPIPELAAGSLGLVESSWWRKPLLLAWYRFNGLPLPSGVLDAFEYKAQLGLTDGEPTAMATWEAQARAVAVALAPESVSAQAPLDGGNRWDQLENCPNDAWDQARRTLIERSKVWGAKGPALRDWLEAQHRVFARCPLGPAYYRTDLPGRGPMNPEYAKQFLLPDMTLPDPPANAPALLVKDRAYQRAAALLYEGHYPEAEAAFKAIAADESSPWREWGMYLAFRARLRSVQMMVPSDTASDSCRTAGCSEERADARALRRAESTRLRAEVRRAIVVANSANRRDEARRLTDLDALIGARLDPAKRFEELAAVLKNPNAEAAEFGRAVTDYLLLHRQFPPNEPMGEWLAGLINGYDSTDRPCALADGESKPPSAYPDQAETECRRLQWSQESLRRFEQAPTQYAWLFSASALAHRDDTHIGSLLAALSKVPEGHPGAATFMLQRLRLGSREDGLRIASALMERPDITSDYSARNRVREYRLWHAADLADFCRDAQRESGVAFDPDTLLRSGTPAPKSEPIWGWDADAKWILNYELPHSALIDVAQRTACLPALRSVARSMAWSRAVLRKDVVGAREALAVTIKVNGHSLSPQLTRVVAIKDDRTFLLEGGLMIGTAQTWGACRMASSQAGAYTPYEATVIANLSPSLGRFAKNVLSAERYAQWQQERKEFDALPDLDSVWMQNVLALAEAFPGDQRVPGLLREAVYRTRMNGCAERSAGALSKAAFELLKRNYPKSKEALTTKYWFKPGA